MLKALIKSLEKLPWTLNRSTYVLSFLWIHQHKVLVISGVGTQEIGNRNQRTEVRDRGSGDRNYESKTKNQEPGSRFSCPFCTEKCARRTKKCATKSPYIFKSQRYQQVGLWYACCILIRGRSQRTDIRYQISEDRYQKSEIGGQISGGRKKEPGNRN